MSTKFTSCTLGIMYREKRKDGRLMGGPMEYLQQGLAELGWKRLGRTLAIVFCILCIGGSLGGGGAFQVRQSMDAISQKWPIFFHHSWIYGLLMALLVGFVMMKGIKRIARVSSWIVPLMCLTYIAMACVVLVSNITNIPQALWTIVEEAFRGSAAFGGFAGVFVTGIQRAVFSNEAGLGSAAIAHSAAKVDHPVEEGVVAMLGPFIDTVCICTMTALVIITTGAYKNPEYSDLIHNGKGAALVSGALSEVVSWFPHVLNMVVFLFAFSTIISWSYYGERCCAFAFGEKYSGVYKGFLMVMIFMSSIVDSIHVLDFSTLMILSMAFPNLIGLMFLMNKAKKSLEDYQTRLTHKKSEA